MLWCLIKATKDTLLAREARLQMFGESSSMRSNSSPAGPAPKVAKTSTSSAPQLVALQNPSSVISALLDRELLEKAKWIRRL